MNSTELRDGCARKLEETSLEISRLTAFVGLDGFVDEIIHVVDKRERADSFARMPKIADFAERIASASGRSTNIELVTQLTKLGGNGPILANALAYLGVQVTYLGGLGYPALHPVFEGFAGRAEVYSISEACHTDALEFEDGKLLLGKLSYLNEITWANIQARFGREKFAAKFGGCNLVAFVNWTMIPFMSEIWEALLEELCPHLTGPRRCLFFDLADPAKRSEKDITRALELIVKFGRYFDVILGANEKEACAIAQVMGIEGARGSLDEVAGMAREMQKALPLDTLVIHPVTHALGLSGGKLEVIQGPYIPKPLITTGGGDHFNAGFCLGKMAGFDLASSLLLGVASSGHYVRTARSPVISDLTGLLRSWPGDDGDSK